MLRSPSLNRRALLGAGLALACPAVLRAQEPVRVRDLLGREVVLHRPARRVVLGQGRLLSLMGLVHPDPVGILAGWAGDMRKALPTEYDAWRRRFPAVDSVPVVAQQMSDDFPLEAILATQPDLVLLSRTAAGPLDGQGRSARVDLLASSGVPVAVVDCIADPLVDTLPSIAILGRLLGQDERTGALSAFYGARLAAIRARFGDPAAAPSSPRPSVLVHRHAGGKSCCWSVASGSFADLVAMAGGHNIAAEVLTKPLGQLNLEFVLTRQPEIYIATGGVYGAERGGLALGAGVAAEKAARSLAALVADPNLAPLSAIANRRAFGLWHGFNETPLHVVALEALAGWIHPDSRAEFDPDRTLREFNERFAAVPVEGAYWTGLPS